MKHDYQSYIYKLAKWDDRWYHITHLNNLFKRYLVLTIIGIIGAFFAEIGVDILTNIVLWGVNIIRVIEYEPRIDFSAHYFSVLVLGNFAVLVLMLSYLVGSKLHDGIETLKKNVHGAQHERKMNELANQQNHDNVF